MLDHDLHFPLEFQMAATFIASFLISPWSREFLTFFLALLVFETFLYCHNKIRDISCDFQRRLLIVGSSILGWLTGRIVLRLLVKFDLIKS